MPETTVSQNTSLVFVRHASDYSENTRFIDVLMFFVNIFKCISCVTIVV